MKISIGKRLTLGFGGLLFIVLIFGIYIIVSSQNNKKVSEKITDIYTPSKTILNKYYNTIDNSKMLIKSWVFIDKIPKTPDKIRLVKLHDSIFPNLVKELDNIKSNWNDTDKQLADFITKQVKDTLFVQHKKIMTLLNNFEAYDKPEVVFETQPAVEDGGDVILMTKKILDNLSILINKIDEQDSNANKELKKSFASFQTYIIVLLILLLIASFITGFFTSRSILIPVYRLNKILNSMSKGEISEIENVDTGDEIGEMSLSLNNVVKKLTTVIFDIKNSALFLSNHSKTLTKQAKILSTGAKEQADAVSTITSSSDEIVTSLDTTSENSKIAENNVNKIADTIKNSDSDNKIISEIENTQQIVKNITFAINEHSSEVENIKKIAILLKSIAQQNSAFSGEMSSNSKDLELHIEKLMESVSFFKINSNVPDSKINDENNNNSDLNIEEDAGDNFEAF